MAQLLQLGRRSCGVTLGEEQFMQSLVIADSVLLILELNTLFSGFRKVSGEPLRLALAQLGN